MKSAARSNPLGNLSNSNHWETEGTQLELYSSKYARLLRTEPDRDGRCAVINISHLNGVKCDGTFSMD